MKIELSLIFLIHYLSVVESLGRIKNDKSSPHKKTPSWKEITSKMDGNSESFPPTQTQSAEPSSKEITKNSASEGKFIINLTSSITLFTSFFC
jgi:hypothetical protein